MTAEHAPTEDVIAGPGVLAPTYWRVTLRDEKGRPTEMVQMRDVATVRDARGAVLGYSVGFHPSHGVTHPMDVVVKPAEPEPTGSHACAMLASLDCYAAAGDHEAAALARWYEAHPDGPRTAAEHVEEQAIRAGFMKRQH